MFHPSEEVDIKQAPNLAHSMRERATYWSYEGMGIVHLHKDDWAAGSENERRCSRKWNVNMMLFVVKSVEDVGRQGHHPRRLVRSECHPPELPGVDLYSDPRERGLQ